MVRLPFRNKIELAESQPTSSDFAEAGATGQSSYTSIILNEYNPDLIGLRAVEVYDKMRKGDAQVRATLKLLKSPLLSAQWYVEPASDDDGDKAIADCVFWALNSMSKPLLKILNESLSCLDFGYYPFEKVFEYGDYQGRRVAKWKKWAPRHPKTIVQWLYDDNGGVAGYQHLKLAGKGASSQIPIPIRKTLLFNIDEEGGNPEGISILRSAYKHWYFKDNFYKIDGIQKERHGIGIPDIQLPPNYSDKDKKLADEMAKNLRTNEKAFIVRPVGFIVGLLELGGGQTIVDPLKSAMHHDMMIARNILGQFLNVGSDSTGTGSSVAEMVMLFMQEEKALANNDICGVINQFAIPQFVNYNFMGVEAYPKLKVRGIGSTTDIRAFSVAARNFIESGMLTPDPITEAWLRDYTDLPKASSEAMDRSVEDRTDKKPGDTSNRVPMPTDGG